MKRMKKRIITLLIMAALAVLGSGFAGGLAVNISESIEKELDTGSLEKALPESAGNVLGDITVVDGGDYMSVFGKIWNYVKLNGGKLIKSAIKSSVLVLIVAILTSAVTAVFDSKNDYAVTAGVAAIGAITVSNAASFISLGKETLNQLSAFSKVLLPTLASAAAMSGGYTSSGAKYAVSMLFIDVLISCGEYLVIPVICAYLAAGIGNAALGGEGLSAATNFLKWMAATIMTTLMIGFTAFLSVTGIVSGSVDAVTQRLTKTAISTALPVVGGIVSDASGAMAAGAGVLKNAVGVFGMGAVLAVCIVPFLKIGAGYLAYKASAGLAGTVADARISKLLGAIGTAFGMILGLVGSAAVMLFVSVILFMKAVT